MTEGLWGQGPKKSSRYFREDCLRVKEFRAGISTAALPDVEDLREKMEFAPGFVNGDLGGLLLGVFQNRFPFNIKFRFTLFGPMYFSMAARTDFWRFFF